MKADLTCLFSAILFVVSFLLGMVVVVQGKKHGSFNYNDFRNFDPTYIQEQWKLRTEHRSLELTYGILNAVAWVAFSIPLLKLAWIQSSRGTRQLGVHLSIAALAIAGSMTELLSRLIYIGSTNALEWLSEDFALDNWTGNGDSVGWKTLEMIQIATRGLLLWIDAVEFLFLAIIFGLLFLSIRSVPSESRLFSMKWARMGVFLSVLSIFEFIAAVLRFGAWRTFSTASLAITSISRIVLFPIWLVWLAQQLPKAELLSGTSKDLDSPEGQSENTEFS